MTTSFFEKLKKGMGVEIYEREPRKIKERPEKKPVKESKLSAEQVTPPKKRVRKLKVEPRVDEDKSSSSPSLSRATAKGEEESLLSSPSASQKLGF